MNSEQLRKIVFIPALLLCFLPIISTAIALLIGIFIGVVIGNPWTKQSSRFSKIILQISVVGLGFGVTLGEVINTGKSSLLYTIIGITLTLLIGALLGKLFKVEQNTSTLISFGTAICGGSAIAAMAPVLKAEDEETAVALSTVFTLNSVALLLFPLAGHLLNLNQETFGIWAGLAIHDTSSVVGAASSYGAPALVIATTVKLTRAIWITPLVILASLLKGGGSKTKIPLFIIGFIIAAASRTVFPEYGQQWGFLATVAKQCLVVSLFLVGSGLSSKVLGKVGIRPLIQAVSLWLIVSGVTLMALLWIGIV